MDGLSRSDSGISPVSKTIPDTNLRNQHRLDLLFRLATRFFAFLVLLLLAGIIVSLLAGSLPALRAFGPGFLTSLQWNPVTEQFGALVPIVGTLVTAIELLAAIPSIIYGMWGLFVFAPAFAQFQPWLTATLGAIPLAGILFQGPPMGIGVLTAGIILAIMVVPFIAAVMRDVFEVVPSVLKESAYALGSTTWEVVWNVVLPYTKVGVVGGVMLGLGRALGETMAVTFVIGNAHKLNPSLMMPGNSIASALANEFTEAVGDLYSSALIELGMILFLITFVVLALSKMLLLRLGRMEGQKT